MWLSGVTGSTDTYWIVSWAEEGQGWYFVIVGMDGKAKELPANAIPKAPPPNRIILPK